MWDKIKAFFASLFTPPPPPNSIPSPLPAYKPDALRKKGAGEWLIPFAIQNQLRMPTHGKYAGGYPRGAIVHFTSGHDEKGLSDAVNTINYGRGQGYAYLCIARGGEIVQAHSVDEWGYHAGESKWTNKLVGNLVGSVSDDLIGIEICNGSKLERTKDGRFKTWFGTYIAPSEVRYVTEAAYGCPDGYYQKYTPEQEATLTKTLLWLKANDPTGLFSFDDVLGHHEVAGKRGIGYFRKNDPGGALSMSMDDFRARLKTLG